MSVDAWSPDGGEYDGLVLIELNGGVIAIYSSLDARNLADTLRAAADYADAKEGTTG